jgi:hypothetical protein
MKIIMSEEQEVLEEPSEPSVVPTTTAKELESPTKAAKASKATKDVPAAATKKRKRKTGDKKRPSNKPRRPMSAYNYFFRDERPKVLVEVEESGVITGEASKQQKSALFSEVGRRVAAKWRKITKEDLERYQKMADSDMERYRGELKEYQLEQARKRHLEEGALAAAGAASAGHFPTAADAGNGHLLASATAAGVPGTATIQDLMLARSRLEGMGQFQGGGQQHQQMAGLLGQLGGDNNNFQGGFGQLGYTNQYNSLLQPNPLPPGADMSMLFAAQQQQQNRGQDSQLQQLVANALLRERLMGGGGNQMMQQQQQPRQDQPPQQQDPFAAALLMMQQQQRQQEEQQLSRLQALLSGNQGSAALQSYLAGNQQQQAFFNPNNSQNGVGESESQEGN